MTPRETQDFALEAAKGTPAIAGATASAMTLNEWLMAATAAYIVIQALYLLRKWWREEIDREYERLRRRSNDAREDAEWAEDHKPKNYPCQSSADKTCPVPTPIKKGTS